MLVTLTTDLYKCVITQAGGVRWKAWLLDVTRENGSLSALLFAPFGPGELTSDMKGKKIRIDDFKTVKKIVSENEMVDMWADIGEVYHPAPTPLPKQHAE